MQYILSAMFGLMIFFRRNKKQVLGTFLWLFLLLLCISNYVNADYFNYENYYNQEEYFPMEIGWKVLNIISIKMGLSYTLFRTCFFTLFFVLLLYTIKTYTSDSYDVLYCYFIFPYFWDVVQLRNTAVCMILLVAIKFLMKKDWENDIIYICLICLASTFHIVALWYLLFLIPKHFNSKALLFVVTLMAIIIGCICAYIGIIEEILGLFFERERVLQYTHTRAHLGVLVGWSRVALPMIIYWIFYDHYKKTIQPALINGKVYLDNKENYKNMQFDRFADLLFGINCINLLICILICYNSIFFRIVRNTLLLNIIFIVHIVELNVKWKRNILLKIFVALLALILVALPDYIGNPEGTLYQIMQYNIFS